MSAKKLCIFDLDGVVCTTAQYHYLAWEQIAEELEIPFTEQDNEALKGVSRIAALELLLQHGTRTYTSGEKQDIAARKNEAYLGYIQKLTRDTLVPGIEAFLESCRAAGALVALGSASKNSRAILQRLCLTDAFDYIVDGTMVSKAKPDPEVFLASALHYGIAPKECIVFEDAAAGVQAAHNAGMQCVGIGTADNLPEAEMTIPNFENATFTEIAATLNNIKGEYVK